MRRTTIFAPRSLSFSFSSATDIFSFGLPFFPFATDSLNSITRSSCKNRWIDVSVCCTQPFEPWRGEIPEAFRFSISRVFWRARKGLTGDYIGVRGKSDSRTAVSLDGLRGFSSRTQIAQMFHEIARKSRWLYRAQKLLLLLLALPFDQLRFNFVFRRIWVHELRFS